MSYAPLYHADILTITTPVESFMEALRTAASLTEKDISKSFSVPVISSLPIVGGYYVP